MEGKIDVIQGDYNQLVVKLQSLDAKLVVIEAQEVAKQTELAVRKELLAERLRSAYDTDRTSLSRPSCRAARSPTCSPR